MPQEAPMRVIEQAVWETLPLIFKAEQFEERRGCYFWEMR
jgi:hypothetical protein